MAQAIRSQLFIHVQVRPPTRRRSGSYWRVLWPTGSCHVTTPKGITRVLINRQPFSLHHPSPQPCDGPLVARFPSARSTPVPFTLRGSGAAHGPPAAPALRREQASVLTRPRGVHLHFAVHFGGCLATGTPPTPRVTFRWVADSLRGPGQSPVLPFACCVGSLSSVGRCGRCSCWCPFRVRGAQ